MIDSVAGDARTGSYEEFVAARSATLFRTAYLLTGSRADAEDLLQVALVKVYAAWRRVSRATSPEAYARRTLVNAFVSSRRPARFTRERLVHSPPDAAVHDPDPDDRLALWPLVSALPPRQRAVVVLRYYEGLSEREIAEELRIAPGTVKSTCSAALRSLRETMGEQA
ncbi:MULTISPECIES: SigE family RNA polymerase sigma factor [Nocardioides]|uniref:RNA polymerase sigma-70 factor, sigma-E family n=1 Tax=Nocardioides lianchengensis TaxID=1045774 RepID=A0A1G6M4E7_9ACTN|nr:SigE family RNA polymerase sigma factor [Nocardioides lianchengensis]NYG12356.1 RNA polymerase sigma-70 factor (sigma-E family) [Nocardioides lianchengensis]SDC50373.1 RNA polymerase sigma-70 factor, sigma-E family [Nocardioides lianchengensis]